MLDDTLRINWSEAIDPDSALVSYMFLLSASQTMIDADTFEVQTNSISFSYQTLIETLFPSGAMLDEVTLYWDVSASDGAFENTSDNGPFLLHVVNSEDPANNEETYLDLFISDIKGKFKSSKKLVIEVGAPW